MKKILLATTMLTMSAGYAAAEVVWGASATFGIAQNGTHQGGTPQAGNVVIDPITGVQKLDPITGMPVPNTGVIDAGFSDNKYLSYSSASITMAAAGQTDGGFTFGANFDFTVGTAYTFADDDGFANKGALDPTPTIFFNGAFGKLVFSTDNLDGFDGDEPHDGSYDVQYDGTFGGADLSVQADLNSGDIGGKLGYTVAGFRLGGEYSMLHEKGVDDIWNVSASYTLGALVLTAADDNVQDVSIGAVYTVTEGVTAGLTYHTGTTRDSDLGNDKSYIDLVAGYTGNGISINAYANNVTNANSKNLEWSVEASYDLGGGLAVNGGINYTEDVYVGATMTF